MITQCIKTIMMWAGSICPGPGEQELGMLRWEAYANLTLQRPHLTSAGSSVCVCVRAYEWWVVRKKARKRTNKRKVGRMNESSSVETGECVLAFDSGCCFKSQNDAQLAAAKVTTPYGPYFSESGRPDFGLDGYSSELWDEWRLLSPRGSVA